MPVSLPPAFAFSQSSMQDYADCARRFQLRYLMQQEWPAPAAEPLGEAEQADSLGRRFHRLLERHFLGLTVERTALDPALLAWWDAFSAHPIPALPATVRRPETITTAEIGGQRMQATYDLLAYEPGGEAWIVDWKTTKHRPTRNWLDHRLQTVLYPLLLVESAPALLGYELKPEQVRLVYWFATAPGQSEVFAYSAARRDQDRRAIETLLQRLLSTEDAVWPLTLDTGRCRLCQYRSLCDRGKLAGRYDEGDDEETASAAFAATDPTLAADDYVL